jgi:hypothetical protein
MDELETKIRSTITKVEVDLVGQGVTNVSTWTRSLMNELYELANEHFHLRVWTGSNNDYDPTTNEWLYDMVWYESFDERGLEIKSIHMIMESEWNRSLEAIKYDFYKLLQGRAKLRVMLFQANDVSLVIQQLVGIIQQSSISENGDKYLLVGWNDDDGFSFTSHVKTI